MKTLYTLLILAILVPGVQAQQIQLIPSEMYAGNFEPIHRKLNYKDIQGSPYLNDELMKGYVKFKSGDSVVYFFRYNVFMDEMEYLNGEKLYAINNAREVDHIYVDGHLFYYTKYKIRNTMKEGYLERLTSGIAKLYIQYDIDFEKKEKGKSSYEKVEPDRFVEKMPNWYYSTFDGEIQNFDPNTSGLKDVFRNHYPAIKTYMKQEKLRPRKKEDLTKIFNFYSSLLEDQ